MHDENKGDAFEDLCFHKIPSFFDIALSPASREISQREILEDAEIPPEIPRFARPSGSTTSVALRSGRRGRRMQKANGEDGPIFSFFKSF
jgi:hypothetical protein